MAGNKTSTAKASTNGATNKSRRSASVSSARVLAMYQAALDEGQSYGDFMMRLKKVGGYSSEKKAAARLHRFKSYLRKKYDVEQLSRGHHASQKTVERFWRAIQRWSRGSGRVYPSKALTR